MLNSASLKLLGRAVHNVCYLRNSESELHFDIQFPLRYFGDYTVSRPPCSRIVAVNNISDRVPLQSLCQLSCNRGREWDLRLQVLHITPAFILPLPGVSGIKHPHYVRP